MDQENDFEEILEPSPYCCIYRIPPNLRKINEDAYTPRLISIGPLHYGREELRAMEGQKIRYWSSFGERVTPVKLIEFETYIKERERNIRAHYSVTSTLESRRYVKMILYDAIFIIELFFRKYHSIDDFLLKSPLGVYIEKDLLLLENQLPYFVLNDLCTKAFPNIMESLFALFLNYAFGLRNSSPFQVPEPQIKHFTDFYRFIYLYNKPQTIESDNNEIFDLPCATKLKKSGLKFSGCNKPFLLDISLERRKKYGKWFPCFEVNELQIPTIDVSDNMERLFRNLMAFEMFHYPAETHICHYAALMDQLIDTKEDVDLFVENKIIVKQMGDNEEIAKMFNRLVSQIILSDHSCFNDIAKKMNAHYKYPWNHAKATLNSVYFRDLWTGTATVAATLLLILTLIQTIYSVM